MSELGDRLRAMRKAAKLSQYQLAARLGVTQPAVSQIERGEHRSGFDTVSRWVQACGIRIAFRPLEPTLADELAEQLEAMPEPHLLELAELIVSWDHLSESQRGMVRSTVERGMKSSPAVDAAVKGLRSSMSVQEEQRSTSVPII